LKGLEVVDKPPVYRDVALPTAPNTEITAKGDIVYTEISRTNIRKLESYVKGQSTSLTRDAADEG
jgi:fatty acid synthase subunit alpha